MKDRPSYLPPRWAQRLLRWSCPPESLEDVEGDLHELYSHWAETLGEKEARRLYVMNAIRLQRPFYAHSRKYHTSRINLKDMLHHYLLLASRILVRSKSFSFINIFGLALGLAASLMIFLWVQDERSVDNFHANKETLYRVYSRTYYGGQLRAEYNTPAPLPAELKKVIPEIEYASGFVKYFRLSLQDDIYETFRVDDKVHKLKGGRAEEDFFHMFSYELLQGTPDHALRTPESLAISRKMAEIFFGSAEAAIGKSVKFDGRKELVVTAVFENVPSTSSDRFDYLMNWDAWVKENPFKQSWGHFGTSTYIKLRGDADRAAVEAKIRDFMKPFMEGAPDDFRVELALQPFGEQYLYSSFENGVPSTGRIVYVRLFTGVGIFILLIACINFMNLATARSVKRAKEVGIRKVVGSSRILLTFQFIGEAVLLTSFAVLGALIIVGLAMTPFNMLTAKDMSLPFDEPLFILMLIGLVLVTGVIAGSYPALLLSSLQPVKTLKGSYSFTSAAGLLRRGLVVFQFVLSLVLLIATLVISQQMNFMQNKNLGYDKENIIYIPIEGNLIEKYSLFREEASRMPGIKVVDRSSQFPHAMAFKRPVVDWPGRSPEQQVIFAMSSVGYDFVKAMGLEVVEGRDFSRDIKSDSTNFLINEEAVRQMGIDDPVGKRIAVFDKVGEVVGVLKDYHTSSLHERIDPVVLDVKESLNFGTVLVRTEPGQTARALESLEEVCKKINPDFPFLYTFMDQQYGELYKSEQVVRKLSHVFAALAIVISCMGLFGLSIFSAEQRRKELGIRKILGATVGNIIVKFSNDFLKLVMVALVIAIPLSWLGMHAWLANFAYRIGLAWWIFASAGVIAIVLCLLTIGSQAVRAAMENPVKNLRAE